MKFKAKPKLTPNKLRERLYAKEKTCSKRKVAINFTSFDDSFGYCAEDLVGYLNELIGGSTITSQKRKLKGISYKDSEGLIVAYKSSPQFNDADFY